MVPMLFKNEKGELFADTAAVSESGYAVPGAELKHIGFGEFTLVVPGLGEVEFDRMRGVPFEGCSGRSHKVYGPEAAVAKLVESLGIGPKVVKAESAEAAKEVA
jgi:hypothetical protein